MFVMEALLPLQVTAGWPGIYLSTPKNLHVLFGRGRYCKQLEQWEILQLC